MPPLRLVERARNFGKVRKRKKRRPIGDTILGTQLLLTTLRDSSDVCPPLKSIVGGLCKILETIEVCGSFITSFDFTLEGLFAGC